MLVCNQRSWGINQSVELQTVLNLRSSDRLSNLSSYSIIQFDQVVVLCVVKILIIKTITF